MTQEDLAAAHFVPTIAPADHQAAFRNLNMRLQRLEISLRVAVALQFQDDAGLEASARRDLAAFGDVVEELTEGDKLLHGLQDLLDAAFARVAVVAARLESQCAD
jgi:hypothetical protein